MEDLSRRRRRFQTTDLCRLLRQSETPLRVRQDREFARRIRSLAVSSTWRIVVRQTPISAPSIQSTQIPASKRIEPQTSSEDSALRLEQAHPVLPAESKSTARGTSAGQAQGQLERVSAPPITPAAAPFREPVQHGSQRPMYIRPPRSRRSRGQNGPKRNGRPTPQSSCLPPWSNGKWESGRMLTHANVNKRCLRTQESSPRTPSGSMRTRLAPERRIPNAGPSPPRYRPARRGGISAASPKPGADTSFVRRLEQFNSAAPQARSRATETTIHITIGRVEVRAVPAESTVRKTRDASPVMSLHEYLQSKSKRGGV